jgi:hypothetical protein
MKKLSVISPLKKVIVKDYRSVSLKKITTIPGKELIILKLSEMFH